MFHSPDVPLVAPLEMEGTIHVALAGFVKVQGIRQSPVALTILADHMAELVELGLTYLDSLNLEEPILAIEHILEVDS